MTLTLTVTGEGQIYATVVFGGMDAGFRAGGKCSYTVAV